MYAFHLLKTRRASYLLENQIPKTFTPHSRFFPLFSFILSFLFVYNFTFLSNFLYYLFIVLSLKLLILAKSYLRECRRKSTLPNILSFHVKVKLKYETEKYRAIKNSKRKELYRKCAITSFN